MKKKKVIIKCTENQAYLIELALDVLSRMSSGQLEEMIKGIEHTRRKWFNASTTPQYTAIIKSLKTVLFPELRENESYGVGNKEIGDAQIMYEMAKRLGVNRAKREKHSKYSVAYYEPLHYSKEPLIEVIDEK